jgi:hypothetical protein
VSSYPPKSSARLEKILAGQVGLFSAKIYAQEKATTLENDKLNLK